MCATGRAAHGLHTAVFTMGLLVASQVALLHACTSLHLCKVSLGVAGASEHSTQPAWCLLCWLIDLSGLLQGTVLLCCTGQHSSKPFLSCHWLLMWPLPCSVQVCGEGYVLDLKLPGGAPHVVLLSLLLLLADLREQAGTLLTPADNNSAKVLLRLPVQVRCGSGWHGCRGLGVVRQESFAVQVCGYSPHQPAVLCRQLELQPCE